ncbi:hypothetical protein FRC01_003060 [Tulasnella sp. 417]|nr:hypothetical protein FRC01_003060 [Tulasnella sp. 417]
MAPSSKDPRDDSLSVSFTLPKSWATTSDNASSSAMLLAGVAMITRNQLFVWPALFMSVSAYLNQQPLRLKDGGMGFTAILAAVGCLITVSLPRFIIQPDSVPAPGAQAVPPS